MRFNLPKKKLQKVLFPVIQFSFFIFHFVLMLAADNNRAAR